MVTFIITIIKLIIILGVVATIHEFGHFLFAKLFKMGVNEFSIGFGPKIVQKKYKETMYSLRCIPLGGYCAIEGEDGESDSKNSFGSKNVFQKVVVLVAGVTFNAILAVIIFLAIAFSFPTYTTKITGFTENSVLEKAGVALGDTIYSINGKKVNLQSELINQSFDEGVTDVNIEYIHDGKKYETIVEDAVKNIGYIGISFIIDTNTGIGTNEIEMVAAGGVSANAGLKAGDKITSVNGIQTATSNEVVTIIREHPNESIDLVIDRNGEIINRTVETESKPLFDLNITSTEKVKTTLPLAFYSTYDNVKTIVGSYVDLFKGKVGIEDMSGIVGIGEVVSKTNGILEFFNLMGIISLAVGVANLMPFPPLDGGKVVIVIGEWITRKKISPNVEAIISYIGFGLLIALTLVVTYNDIVRII